MGAIYSWLKSVVIFMIFLTILSNLLGKSDFKKYVNLTTGLLLVLVTVNPILKFISSDKGFDYFYDSINLQMESTEVANEMKDAKENQQKEIINEYKRKIEEQMEQLLKERDLNLLSSEIIIDEDSNSEEYAHIKRIQVDATYLAVTKESESKVAKVVIPEIEIGVDREQNNTEKENKGRDVRFLSPMEIQIRNMLAEFYHILPDNIEVRIQM